MRSDKQIILLSCPGLAVTAQDYLHACLLTVCSARCLAEKLNRSFCFLFSPRTTSGSQSDSRWNPAGPGVTGGNQSPACKLQLWDPQDGMESETSKVEERWVLFSPYTMDSSSLLGLLWKFFFPVLWKVKNRVAFLKATSVVTQRHCQ